MEPKINMFGKTENNKSDVSFHITNISFNDGTKLNISPNEIVVIVGPNNVGKTACLREILDFLKGNDESRYVITGVDSIRSGSSKDLMQWFEAYFVLDNRYSWFSALGSGERGIGGKVHVHDLDGLWKKGAALGVLVDFFCRFMSTEKRLASTLPAENIDIFSDVRDNAIQLMLDNKKLEENLSIVAQEAFNTPLFLNRWQGRYLQLHLGVPPSCEPWSKKHAEELSKIPEVSTQGDGFRSFIGCILESYITTYFVTMIDEPEVFLHPSHARILGRALVRNKPENRQYFIATHSIDFLRGILDAGRDNIRIIRITRDGAKNPIKELNTSDIKKLWSDSLLRSSNVLDGLFHERVIVCESDADCRFYSSVLDSMLDLQPGKYRPDVMFINVGGKHRIHIVVRALMALGVSVSAIADFDVLKEKNNLKEIIEAFGGNWNNIEDDWSKVTNALNQISPPLSLNQTKQEITAILQSQFGQFLQQNTIEEIKEKLKMVSPWAAAKRSGKSSIPSGHPFDAYIALEQELRRLGLYIVEVGELERFVPSVGSHGPTWLNRVLEKDIAKDTELDEARKFISSVLDLD